jgi:hypothetical protein
MTNIGLCYGIAIYRIEVDLRRVGANDKMCSRNIDRGSLQEAMSR